MEGRQAKIIGLYQVGRDHASRHIPCSLGVHVRMPNYFSCENNHLLSIHCILTCCESSDFSSTLITKLLNDPTMRTVPQKFSVCENGASYSQTEVSNVVDVMKKVSPSGVTPLTRHIWDIQNHIFSMADELRRSGKIVAIIVATDGQSRHV
jgi:hypothetical protein